MEVRFSYRGKTYSADVSRPVDLSVAVRSGGVSAWGQEPAIVEPHREAGFTGSIAAGASVNFNDIRFNPHAHGTHTESPGHITREGRSVLEAPPSPWLLARLITLEPIPMEAHYPGSERPSSTNPQPFSPKSTAPDPGNPEPGARITLGQLQAALGEAGCDAVVIRTLPNPADKKSRSWSGTNPAWLEASAAAWLASEGVVHLLIDLPSVDPEVDGGALAAHRAFWGLPVAARMEATITELIYVPDALPDGLYLLNLQMAAFENDAAPSRPLLFELTEV